MDVEAWNGVHRAVGWREGQASRTRLEVLRCPMWPVKAKVGGGLGSREERCARLAERGGSASSLGCALQTLPPCRGLCPNPIQRQGEEEMGRQSLEGVKEQRLRQKNGIGQSRITCVRCLAFSPIYLL